MTVMEFFGCAFIAYGPPLSLFIFTISHDPLRIIIVMASAFFWLVSLLLSSILWVAVVPLREQLAFGLVFSVLFQELFRFLFCLFISKAEAGLAKLYDDEEQRPGDSNRTVRLTNNKHLLAYVTGYGFGIMSGTFSLINVLADSIGPGTVGLNGDSDYFFIVSAFMTLCFIFLHIFWAIIFHHGMETKKYYWNAIVVVSHMAVSCLSLMNQGQNPIYLATIIPAYIVMFIMAGLAFVIAGGSPKNIKACVTCSQARYDFR